MRLADGVFIVRLDVSEVTNFIRDGLFFDKRNGDVLLDGAFPGQEALLWDGHACASDVDEWEFTAVIDAFNLEIQSSLRLRVNRNWVLVKEAVELQHVLRIVASRRESQIRLDTGSPDDPV